MELTTVVKWVVSAENMKRSQLDNERIFYYEKQAHKCYTVKKKKFYGKITAADEDIITIDVKVSSR